MEKFIPYEKLSKKEKRKMDLAKRQTWGELNPVTRKPENSRAYNRRKSQNWKRDLPPTDLRLFCFIRQLIPDGLLLRCYPYRPVYHCVRNHTFSDRVFCCML